MNYDELLNQIKQEHEQRVNSINAAREENERQMAEFRRQEEQQRKQLENARKEYEKQQQQAAIEHQKRIEEQNKMIENARKEEAEKLENARKEYEKQQQQAATEQQKRVEEQNKLIENGRKEEEKKFQAAKEQYEKEEAKKQELINKQMQYEREEQAAIRGEVTTNKSSNNVSTNTSANKSSNNISTHITTNGINDTNIIYSADELLANQNSLDAISSEIRSFWDSIKNTELVDIQNSWAGNDAKAYIDNINQLDSKIENSIKAINLLSRTFNLAASTLQETQENSIKMINNI